MKSEKKAWGHALHVFDSPLCAVSILHTEEGGYCSIHFHKERVNRFICVSGSIDVIRYSPEAEETHRVRLQPGDVEDVPAGEVHSFEVIESGVVVEVYWPSATVRLDDIERIKLGGRK